MMIIADDNLEYVKCNICKKDNSEFLFENYDRLHGIEGKFKIVKCRNCGLVYINPRPINIQKYYPKEYAPHNISQKNFFQNLSDNLMRAYYKKNKNIADYFKVILYKLIYNPIPKEFKGKLLDIGCGNGSFLYSLNRFGWDTYGVEPSENAVSLAIEKYGLINIKQGSLENCHFPNTFFNVVIMAHTLEHLVNPSDTIFEIHRILKKDGLLIITTPNVSSLNSKIFKQYCFHLETPRHLNIFSVNTLHKLLYSKFNIARYKYSTSSFSFTKSLGYFISNNFFKKYIDKMEVCFLPFTILEAFFHTADIITVIAKKK